MSTTKNKKLKIHPEDLKERLHSRQFKRFLYCQFPGCWKKLRKVGYGMKKQLKYCKKHSNEARNLNIKLWRQNHKEKVKEINRNYYLKRKNENKQD